VLERCGNNALDGFVARKSDQNRATIRDVAQKAGVSVGTASRAINAAAGVTVETRKSVLQAAKDLGYRPNAAARALRSRNSHLIGCSFSDLENPLYARLFANLQDVLADAGFVTLISTTSNRVDRERRTIATFAERGLDGIVIAPGHEKDPELNDLLSEFSAPIFVLDRELLVPADRLRFDHQGGMACALGHFKSLGHRRVLPVFTGYANPDVTPRRRAFDAALADAGLEPIGGIDPEAQAVSVFEALRDVLAGPDRPTALLVQGTRVLGSALNAIANLGLRMPEDISLISIGDSDQCAEHVPPITALAQDHVAIVQIIADRLLARIRNETGPERFDQMLSYRLVERGSCASVSSR
jgi:LacI family transcriptional regulator